jgi:hypothetical protein
MASVVILRTVRQGITVMCGKRDDGNQTVALEREYVGQ